MLGVLGFFGVYRAVAWVVAHVILWCVMLLVGVVVPVVVRVLGATLLATRALPLLFGIVGLCVYHLSFPFLNPFDSSLCPGWRPEYRLLASVYRGKVPGHGQGPKPLLGFPDQGVKLVRPVGITTGWVHVAHADDVDRLLLIGLPDSLPAVGTLHRLFSLQVEEVGHPCPYAAILVLFVHCRRVR